MAPRTARYGRKRVGVKQQKGAVAGAKKDVKCEGWPLGFASFYARHLRPRPPGLTALPYRQTGR